MPGLPQDNPHPALAKQYGKTAQDSIPDDTTKELSKDKKINAQHVVGSILSLHAWAINITLLM
ncbi:hypothetical protein ACHAXS_011401, partial [Conticribra weissflogii]